MRYFSRPSRESAESAYLTDLYGKHYEPFGAISLSDETIMGTDGIVLEEVAGETLAIHPENAAWAFLNAGEAKWYRQLDRKPFGWLRHNVSSHGTDAALGFIAHLYRRGLLTLNSHAAVDHRMFADGANYEEGNLIELLITEKCNLACPYCLAGANSSMPAMDRDIARKTVDLAFAMRESDTLAFEFAGGEPFLKYDLMKETVQYIRNHPQRRNRRLFISTQTNATLLNEERVRWLKEEDVRVGISIDGGAQSQNLSRPQVNGKESFSKLSKGIDLLHRFEVSFGGLVVLNRSNADDPAALAATMLSLGIHGFRLNPVAYLGDARKNWNKVGLNQEHIIGFIKGLMDHIVEQRLPLLEDNVRSMCDFLTSKQRRTRCMRTHCGAGDTFQAIAANGDIYPCGRATQSPGLKLGNIFDPGVESLSQPSRNNVIMAQIRERRPADLEGCNSCSYRQLCQSGCSAQAWERYGAVRHRTPECSFYKTLYPYLMRWLSFDEAAFDHLNAYNYFNNEGMRFSHEFMPLQDGAVVT
ncbi:radical SAM/SPASM domain-containing protein [Nitrosovibrio tenuis]|uniref:Radical SAM additional 4Fe4S-binding SPASM domain-containing protein n=1 Tax=Nitrosovibrio tenuis TaxID=1233 RepID=A0A1H7P689_9PROT|nr:radical SAM protein [Nitrosovibrio tenuis]SEL31119.1 radical SAM additional 4Fe4S-binding SPASM domain-containing protein [Nitrosovibrio tenuis]